MEPETLIGESSRQYATIGEYAFVSEVKRSPAYSTWLVGNTMEQTYHICDVYPKQNFSESSARKIIREIAVENEIGHKYITIDALDDAFYTDSAVYIVRQFLEGGTLADEIYRRNGLNEVHARGMFGEVLELIHLCHQNDIAHGNINSEGIHLFTGDESGNIMLSDFGASIDMDKNRHPRGIVSLSRYIRVNAMHDPSFRAPEIFARRIWAEYSPLQADIWSLGVLLYFMATAKLPFRGNENSSIINKIRSGTVELPSYLSPALKDLLSKMLHKNPRKRVTLSQVQNHPWCHGQAERYGPHLNPAFNVIDIGLGPGIPEGWGCHDEENKENVDDGWLQELESRGLVKKSEFSLIDTPFHTYQLPMAVPTSARPIIITPETPHLPETRRGTLFMIRETVRKICGRFNCFNPTFCRKDDRAAE